MAVTIITKNNPVIISISVLDDKSLIINPRYYAPMLLSLLPIGDDARFSTVSRISSDMRFMCRVCLQEIYHLHIYDGVVLGVFVNDLPVIYKNNKNSTTTRFACDLAYI